MSKFIEPKIQLKSFTCPYCDTLSSITWDKKLLFENYNGYYLCDTNKNDLNNMVYVSTCKACGKYHLWHDKEMIYPRISNVPAPNEDMPENVKEIYLEAMNVHIYSKRAAAALLRLAVQILCKELGEEGKNINHDIGELVKKGLPVKIQKALDSIRVIGNNAVHPGMISFDEKEDVSGTLFLLINIIVEYMISKPKKIDEIYDMLPENAIDGIEKRDANK